MKWTAFLLLAGFLQVSANGAAQQVSLTYRHAPVKTVLRDISRQTGFTFFYNASTLDEAKKIDLNLVDAPLTAALDSFLNKLFLDYSIVNKTIVVKPSPKKMAIPEAPDPVTVSGRVVDETGKPLEGASISVKGSSIGTSASSTGDFTLKVEPGSVLVISFIGFEPEFYTVNGPGGFIIRMKRARTGDTIAAVVLTGYQNIRKESFTGTAVTVTGEELKMINPQHIMKSLQTFDPSFRIMENTLLGSDPNRMPNITVRGSTALPGGSTDIISRNNLANNVNMPTFILDGYEVSVQKIYDLDVNRIQTITLLKDAAATAIYGSRAANGVVVINTKAPKSGKLQVSYNYELNVTSPDLTQYDVLNAEDKLEYERLAGVYDANKNQAMSQDQLDRLYYHHKAAVVGGVNTYWLSQPLRTAFGHKHSLYVEGGDQSLRYGLELRYQTMPGVMQGSGRDRYSTGLSLAYNKGSRFLFRNQLTVTMMKSKESPYGSFSEYTKMNPYYPKSDSTGRTIQVIDTWVQQESAAGGRKFVPVLNPMYNATLGSFDRSEYLEVIDALTMEWNILPGLRFRGLASINKTKTTGDQFVSPFANAFYNYGPDRIDERGSYTYGTNDETSFDGNLTLNYNRQLGEHFINAMAGTNVRTYMSRFRSIDVIGFNNDRFTDIGFAAGYGKDAKPYSRLLRDRLAGAFVSVNYSFANKYLLDVIYRQDGSSKFGSENKVAPFSAIGIGWNLHREAFMAHSPISRLKLRASTGLTGSVSFDPYMSHPTYNYYTGNWYSTGLGAVVNNYGNPNLQWQKTRNYDLGVELGLFDDRIVILPRYYYKLTMGLLADVSLPPSSGFSSYKDNVGDMRNTGLELGIQANILRGKNHSLSVMANMVHNTNTIVKISNSLKAYNDKVDDVQDDEEYKGAPLLRFQEGQSLNAIYAVRSLGIDPENGRELYVKKDGTLTYDWSARDIVPVGNSTPTAEGYFGFYGVWKQFSINLSFYTRFGGDLYNQTLVDRVENADPRFNVDSRVFDEKWKQRGDHTFYKNIADLGTTDVSSRFVQRDNVLELQSLYLGYDMKKILARTPVKNLRLAVTMNEIWRWSSVKQERGIDYPFARSVTFSVMAGF